MTVRFSRHCYDKPWRCPRWAGGGWTSAKNRSQCNGSINVRYEDGYWMHNWTFHRCNSCDVICWPIVTQWLDPTWWAWKVQRFGRKAEEHFLWPLQKAVVLGLYTRPLRFGVTALKLDRRWKTRVWEETP